MANYEARIDPGPGVHVIEVVADNCGSGAIHCVVTIKSWHDDGVRTELWAKDLDALISSLQAARSFVTQ